MAAPTRVRLDDRIIADPGILGGKPVIDGTRISVELVLSQLGRGRSIEDVAGDYGITSEDVTAALRFAARALGEERWSGIDLPGPSP